MVEGELAHLKDTSINENIVTLMYFVLTSRIGPASLACWALGRGKSSESS